MAVGLLLLSGVAQAATVTYGWEDGGTILGTYSDIEATNVDGAFDPVYSGSHSLYLLDQAASGTPQAYVGWITGLQNGDQVTAGFWVYDDTPGASPSGRIWGHYTTDSIDIDSYAGSAGGSSTYSGSADWSYLEYTWTFDDGDDDDRTGLVIEARTYSVAGAYIYLDDLTVTAPDTATIITPATSATVPVPASLWLAGSGIVAMIGVRRRYTS